MYFHGAGLLTMMLMKCTVKLRSRMECLTMWSSQEFLNTEPRRRMKFNKKYSFLEETIQLNKYVIFNIANKLFRHISIYDHDDVSS